MGVRGTARREQKPRANLAKPAMKPNALVPEPPSASTPPTSPTPPPSLVPEPHPHPRLRDDLPPVHAAQLRPDQHPDTQPISRNLLISPVKANRTRNSRSSSRQPSSRIAQNAHSEKKHPEHDQEDPPEEAFTVEFRVYPYPPSTRPLCYPLDQAPHPTGSHAESDSLPGSRTQPARKLLLQRWRDDLAAKEKADIGSTMRDTPSDASQRRLTDSPRVTRKRGRSPPPEDESDDDVPVIHTMSGVAHSMASAPFDLDEGDPVLPMIGASRTVEVRSNGAGRRAPKGDSTEFGRVGSHERLSKYSRVGEKETVKRNSAYFQPSGADHGSLPSSLRGSENEHNSGKTVEDRFSGETRRKKGSRDVAQEATSDEVHSKPSESALQELKSRIYLLKDRRTSLEQQELEEISREALRNSSVTVTKEDRIVLKEEIESLSKHAVRDLLRLISRRMRGLESSPQAEVKEVKLPLDILPADLTKELRLMVLREKGQLALPASDELQKVRTELREVVKEYRRQRKLAGA